MLSVEGAQRPSGLRGRRPSILFFGNVVKQLAIQTFYYRVRIVSFRVRSIPRRPEQGVVRRGRAAPERLARPKAEQVKGMGTTKRVDSTGVNGLAVRLQKLHFMKSLWSNSKVQQSKIQKLVGIRILVERA